MEAQKKIKINRPPGAPGNNDGSEVVETAVKPNIGYIVEHNHVGNKIAFSKVLTANPDKKAKRDDRWITILLHKPTVEFELGSVITFEFGEFENLRTAINAELVTNDTPLSNMFRYLMSPDVVEDDNIREVHPAALAKQFMLHTHTGTGKDSIKAFMVSQDIYTIIGWVGKRRIIVRNLSDK